MKIEKVFTGSVATVGLAVALFLAFHNTSSSAGEPKHQMGTIAAVPNFGIEALAQVKAAG